MVEKTPKREVGEMRGEVFHRLVEIVAKSEMCERIG